MTTFSYARNTQEGFAPDPLPAPDLNRDEFYPDPVEDLEDIDLPESLVTSLIFKYLLQVGEAAGRTCASALCLPSRPVVETLSYMKNQRLVVYKDTSSMGDFIYTLTEEGRDLAKRYMRDSSYVGPAPVRLDYYVRSVAGQSIEREKPQYAHLQDAFSDLLVNEEMFVRLGPAINSARGMLLFGESGNGKTSIAERITKCFGSSIWIPKAIFADGVIINFFDPGVHIPADDESADISDPNHDSRWIRIRRPTIVVGGELLLDALELNYNPVSRITEPSLQLKSNCGTLVIDDFGRQRVDPTDLLNRWIVPLEKRYDYLTLHTGKKIQVPFDQLIIFSTNLEPRDLVDEAFLRRIPYKINVGNPSRDEFVSLFRMVGQNYAVEFDETAIDYLIDRYYAQTDRSFRCCHPRDLVMQIQNFATYDGLDPRMSPESFDKACDSYFAVM